MTKEDWQRAAVVTEALSWLQTPFAHDQCVKGVGADCATFIAAVYGKVGVFRADVPHFQPDWFLHTTKESYVEGIEQHAVEFDPDERPPVQADIVIVRDVAIGAQVYSHGAIVLDWPNVVQCFPPCVMRANTRYFPAFQNKQLRLFNPWEKQ